MSTNLNFRSALNGFNREDVVNYIEFLTNRHVSDLSQMKAQLDAANEEIERLKTQPVPAEDTEALSQAKARITELEAQVATLNGREPALSENAQAELEAYRRAERTERAARQRAAPLCRQANAILADATAKVEEAGSRMEETLGSVSTQLSALQTAILQGKSALRDAATELYALTPDDEDA